MNVRRQMQLRVLAPGILLMGQLFDDSTGDNRALTHMSNSLIYPNEDRFVRLLSGLYGAGATFARMFF